MMKLRRSDLFGLVLSDLDKARFQLLTSIDEESAILNFLGEVREKLTLEDLALYFVNPEHQTLERSCPADIGRLKPSWRPCLDLNNSVAGKAVRAGMPVVEPCSANWAPSNHRLELAIPVVASQEAIAVLDLIIPEGTSFVENRLPVLELLAKDLAIALVNIRAVKRLKKELSHDEITGLYNQKHFVKQLDIEIKRSVRNGSSLGILVLEPDNWAEFAQMGCAVRDRVIQHVARHLKTRSRATDLLGRFSDTEFIWTLAGANIETSLMVGEKLRKLIVEDPFTDLGAISLSIGAAVYPIHATEAEELVFLARQAAYLARHSGGNQVATLGSDTMKTMALKAFATILDADRLHTGPQLAKEVATHLEEVASDPIFSPVVKQIVESLASAIDVKDHYTKNHSEEAAHYAEALGRTCNLPEKQMELVKFAAKLHDLGKIGIPETILNKSGPLDEQEWQMMKEHPALGARILQPIQSLAELVPIIQCHHERWNGSGYPAGLKGTEIPVEARLIAVIDSFHAIISERPYKRAMPVSYALDQLRNQAGTNFDPLLIDKFCSMIEPSGELMKDSFGGALEAFDRCS